MKIKSLLLFCVCPLCAVLLPAQSDSWLMSPQKLPGCGSVPGKDSIAGVNEKSGIAFPFSPLRPGALNKSADAYADCGAVSLSRAGGSGAVEFTDLGTLSPSCGWSASLSFDKSSPDILQLQGTDYYGNAVTFYGYAFKFTLDSPQVLHGTSDNWMNVCRIFSDPGLRHQLRELPYDFLTGFDAGTYYMIIDDHGYLNGSYSEPFVAGVALAVPESTPVTLPCSGVKAGIDQTDLKVAGDYYTKFYKFRVAEETVARFSVSTDTGLDGMDYVELDLFGPNCHDLIVADNRDVPLKPGVYFAAVYGVLMDGAAFWEKNTQLSVDIGISHTGKTIGSISFPCTEKFDFAADSPLRYGSWNTLWYKLSLTEDTMVGIDDPTGSYAFSILTPDMRQFAGYAPYDNPKITTVPAGEYYFVLADFMNGGGSGSFALMSPYNYGKIDFSELIKNGETKAGDNGDFAWTVMIADQSARPSVQTAYTRGWCFDAEAGHIYKLTCGMFTKVENDSYGISLFRTPCTGNPAEDGIRGGSYAVAGRSGTGELSYEAEADGRINLMLFTQADAAEDGDRVYGMSMREIEYTDTDEKTARPYVREITLPYVAHIYLSPEYNTFKSGAEYYKLYKLTLGETTELRMLSGFNPVTGFIPSLHVYTGRDMTEELTPSWGLSEGGGGTVLAPGVYYLKISDNNFHEDRTPGSGSDVYADCMVEIAGVTGADIKPVQTLAEMCADAVTVSYAADMPYTDSGSFLAAGSKFLQDPSLFVTAPLYTKVYKVTGMSAGDRIHVMDKSADKSCFVGIYTLEDGNCVLQADNYGDWEAPFNSLAAHKEFEAPAAADYYVRISESLTYPYVLDIENPRYEVAMWTGSVDDMPATVTPDLPDEYLIAETAAPVSEISVADGVTGAELLMALRALDITATDVKGRRFAFPNSPLSWTVDGDGGRAWFSNIDLPYRPGDAYTPAVVRIRTASGIGSGASDAVSITYSRHTGIAEITGLTGGETVSVFNGSGRLVRRQTGGRIVMGGYDSGVYIVSVRSGGSLAVFKLLK